MLKTFRRIDKMYLKMWLDEEEYEMMIQRYMDKVEALYLKGAISEEEYKAVADKYKN